MEETFEQKVMRNVQGKFAIYKTPAVVGDTTNMPNVEWEEGDDVDKFFMFARNLGAKVIYVTEGEETNEENGVTTTSIIQIGFLFQGVMHHINYADDSDEEEDDEYYDEDDESSEEYSDDDYEEGDGDQEVVDYDEEERDDREHENSDSENNEESEYEDPSPRDETPRQQSQFF
ncbi:MAG: hypothetical protein ACQESE_03380 [Nanobdellota archaeon]